MSDSPIQPSTAGSVEIEAAAQPEQIAAEPSAPVPEETHVSERRALPVRWWAVASYGAMVYLLGVGWAWVLGARLVAAALLPLVPTLMATLAFWSRERWRARARQQRQDAKAWEEALATVCYEAVNAGNAIRANLIAFRLANDRVQAPEHLAVIEESLLRIGSVVQRVQDPVKWWQEKQRRKQAARSIQETAEEARSQIAL